MYRIILILSLSIVLFISGCHNNASPTLRIALLNGPTAIALAPLLDSIIMVEGWKIETTIYDNPSQIQSLMVRREIEVCVLPTTMAALLYSKGCDYRLLGSIISNGLYWVSQDSLPLENPTEIAIFSEGSTPDVLLQYLTPNFPVILQRNYTMRSASHLAHAMIAGTVRHAILAEPYISLVKDKLPSCYIRYELGELANITPCIQGVAVVQHDWIKQHAALLPKLQQLFAMTTRQAQESPDVSINKLSQYGYMPVLRNPQQTLARSGISYTPTPNSNTAISNMLSLIFRCSPNVLGGALPDSLFYTPLP